MARVSVVRQTAARSSFEALVERSFLRRGYRSSTESVRTKRRIRGINLNSPAAAPDSVQSSGSPAMAACSPKRSVERYAEDPARAQ